MNDFAVLFDLNGTIADTERGYFLAYREVLAEHDIDFRIEQFTENWSVKGKKLDDFLSSIGRDELLAEIPILLSTKDRIFQEKIAERTSSIDGAGTLVKSLCDLKIPLGLDSSTTRENILKILSTVGLNSVFSNISSGDMKLDRARYGDVKTKCARLKYLADAMDFPASRCIVIGDAEKDIEGAKQAEMPAIAVPNIYTRKNDFSRADVVCNSMAEIHLELLKGLILGR